MTALAHTLSSSPALHGDAHDQAVCLATRAAAGEDKRPVLVVVALDPESLDATRPDDLDDCPRCDGLGGVQVQTGDPYDGAWDGVECWACGGTGQRGAA